jgi:alpha-L-fucosidase
MKRASSFVFAVLGSGRVLPVPTSKDTGLAAVAGGEDDGDTVDVCTNAGFHLRKNAMSPSPARHYRDTIARVIDDGPYEATWTSLESWTVPEWYEDAKFGIFIHWGVYAVPAFGNEWYPRNMYQVGTPEYEHHLEKYGAHTEFGYKDFIPGLTAEQFDADQWAALFRRAGAQYVVPVAEHHDGFAMYDSALTQWSAYSMGPRRDLIGELATAVRRQSMVFGVSSHRAEHWWFMGGGMDFDSDVRDPAYADFYGPAQHERMPPNEAFLEDWLVRCCELVDKYEPQVFWFDWWIEQPVFAPYLQQFASYFYNRGHEWRRGVAINYKHNAFPAGSAVLDVERGQLASIRPQFWQTDTAVAKNSWGYTEGNEYKRVQDVLGDLVDIVSKNGSLLLNIGPRADGSIPDEDRAMLIEIGDWLRVNGEAIYGTRPWQVFGEGPTDVVEGPFADTKRSAFTSNDIRFTTRSELREARTIKYIYAIALSIPENRRLTIRSFGLASQFNLPEIAEVQLVDGTKSKSQTLEYTQSAEGLEVRLPETLPSAHLVSVRIVPQESSD